MQVLSFPSPEGEHRRHETAKNAHYGLGDYTTQTLDKSPLEEDESTYNIHSKIKSKQHYNVDCNGNVYRLHPMSYNGGCQIVRELVIRIRENRYQP